tara:strand:+ start:2446 stop:4191 length:1746 start_codon:yes stop_codon:yes gene_type:complete
MRVSFPRLTRNIKTGADLIYNKLVEHKVNDVFLYSGGSIMPLIDKFYNGKINYYINTHEQNCGHAATGYAKSSNKFGVVITTSGPGLTNLITPILDAQNDGVPLLVLSGQVGTNVMGTGAFQEAPSVEITKSITKMSYCIKNVEEIESKIDESIKLIKKGRPGVVHLDLPKDILLTDCDLNKTGKNLEEIEPDKNLNVELNNVAKIINDSNNPILFLGKGCNHASKEILEFVNKTQIPFTTTIHGKGVICENHKLSLGWCGMHGSPVSNYALQKADCIIGIGARFDDRTTGTIDTYGPNAKNIFNINIDNSCFNKTVNTTNNIEMDSKIFLESIYTQIENNISSKRWLRYISILKNKYGFKFKIPDNDKINTPMVIDCINKLTKNKDVIFTTGVGNHQMMTYQFINGNYPGKIHSSGSLGVMGAGLPYAIGVQIANPDKLVVDIDGDSSFLMTMSDMKTIVENNLPIKIAIMNDNKQMMVNIWEKLFFDGRYTATINERNPDFKEVAEAFGLKGFICKNQKDIMKITQDFLETEGPALCEYKVEPDICLPLVGPGKALDEMILFEDYQEKNLIFDKKHVPS